MARNSKNNKKNANSGGKTIYKGVIEVTRSGLGYVTVEGLAKDIMIKRENLKNALNGERIQQYANDRKDIIQRVAFIHTPKNNV